MNYKWMGAMLIVAACGAVGFGLAGAYRREEQTLGQLMGALDYMICELRYRLTPLPELFRLAAEESRGWVAAALKESSEALNRQTEPDAEGCIRASLERMAGLPGKTAEAFGVLAAGLGRFNLEGQLQGLEAARSHCRRELDMLRSGREARLRSYQTLGLCAGAALAILFV